MANDTLSAASIQAAIEAGKQITIVSKEPFIAADDSKHVALPSGFQLHKLPEKRKQAPETIKTTTILHDAESFVEYVNRFKNDNTLIFANINGRVMWAVIDYHGKGSPSWVEHKAKLDLVHSEEWKAWTGINKKAIAQSAFAEFLELNMSDIVKPDPLKFYELAQFLTATVNTSIVAAKRMRDGQIQMSAKEDLNIQGPDADFKIPEKITLRLRPFAGGAAVEIEAWLRVRVPRQGGEATFEIQIQRTADILEAAFSETVNTISDGAGIKALSGEFNA